MRTVVIRVLLSVVLISFLTATAFAVTNASVNCDTTTGSAAATNCSSINVPLGGVVIQGPFAAGSVVLAKSGSTITFSAGALATQSSTFILISDMPPVSLSTSVSPSGGGTIVVSPNYSNGKYPVGGSVQFTAVPTSGYAFTNWTGALTGPTNPQTLVLSANSTVTAVFDNSIVLALHCLPTAAPTQTGVAYSSICTVANGHSPYTFTVIGTLPTGLNFSSTATTATVSGTPSAPGAFGYTVRVTDGFGQSDQVDFNGTLTGSGSASGPLALPHFAVGGPWTTGFFVINTSNQPAQYSIAFYDDGGQPATLPFNSGSNNTLSGMLQANGSAYFEAANPQLPVTGGWGKITADPSIVVQALFRNNSNGIYYEASVSPTAGSKEFLIPFDATTFAANGASIYTGFAIANLGQSIATVTCTAHDTVGTVIPSAVQVPLISPLGHWANYLFPVLAGQRGTIDCVSNTTIAVTALRFLGANAFSTLPVVLK